MFLKEQKILDHVKFHDPFPEAKRCLIKRAKSSRRAQERDTIKNILKDPGAVMEDNFDEQRDFNEVIRAEWAFIDKMNNKRLFFDEWANDYSLESMSENDEQAFLNEIFEESFDDGYPVDYYKPYRCMCPSCLGPCMLDENHEK